MKRLSIIVCTFERPRHLARALTSILALDGISRVDLDVVVVDNSDSGSARETVERIAAGAPVPVRYVPAHPANIAVARNAGLAATSAPVVAFIDDDQELERDWLDAVLDGLDRYPHDVFFGPVAAVFEGGARTELARALFQQDMAAPAGTEMFAINRPRSQTYPLSTGNSIFRRRILPDGPVFDPRYGASGGEDFFLFCQLQRRGARFGWLPGARVGEYVPPHRCEEGYIVDRTFAGAQQYAAATIETSPRPQLTQAIIAAKAMVQFLLLAPMLA
ncbi:MAG TPA: glycosyltransferase family 2 protein, partial [Saliniramus sp.]|nr:glycosyltransferase family 2 protein [Saliniramus sp.]